MKKELDISIPAINAQDKELLKVTVAESLGILHDEITFVKVLKRSIDARSRNVKVHLRVEVYINEEQQIENFVQKNYTKVSGKTAVIIVGAGPAGLFAALRLIELGIKPVILERGKDVKTRRRDLAAINKLHIVNPDSNYCFGEGGAGTYSDGKLYTRSTKRGDVNSILNTLVAHGANSDILVAAHPHIGTNKLPQIIVNIRESILNAGGEIHFNSRVTDFIIRSNHIKGVLVEQGTEPLHKDKNEFLADSLILATGHSARDIFELLHKKNIIIEAKPFAMGVRIEHPQELIDSLQYRCTIKEVDSKRLYLPAAPYSIVHQVRGRGVYSFCMCPGGIIAPCATGTEEVVTNGWSPSKRNNPFANSGIVVAIELEDLHQYKQHGVLAGMRYQQELEKMAFHAGGKTQAAPGQRMVDFTTNKFSVSLPANSYQPGTTSAALHELMPIEIGGRLQEAFKEFGKRMKGFLTNEAIIVGVESRTSSTVRIPRDKETMEHIQIKGLYPCGEGAGYAGGIISAAIDGEKCAEKCVAKINGK